MKVACFAILEYQYGHRDGFRSGLYRFDFRAVSSLPLSDMRCVDSCNSPVAFTQKLMSRGVEKMLMLHADS